MAQAKKVELTQKEITVEDSREFSMQIVIEDGYDESIEQEILEIALHYPLRSYKNMIFTSPNETVLKDFQSEILSSRIQCEFVFGSPKKALS